MEFGDGSMGIDAGGRDIPKDRDVEIFRDFFSLKLVRHSIREQRSETALRTGVCSLTVFMDHNGVGSGKDRSDSAPEHFG